MLLWGTILCIQSFDSNFSASSFAIGPCPAKGSAQDSPVFISLKPAGWGWCGVVPTGSLGSLNPSLCAASSPESSELWMIPDHYYGPSAQPPLCLQWLFTGFLRSFQQNYYSVLGGRAARRWWEGDGATLLMLACRGLPENPELGQRSHSGLCLSRPS